MQRHVLLWTALALLGAATPAAAQLGPATVGTGFHFQGYDFADELQVEAANLLLLPVAVQLPVGQRLNADLYTAYARGAALISGVEHTLSGFVDTRLRASYQLMPWALLTVGVNLPTGNAGHTTEEARVAAVLSTELLGFREAAWGLGTGFTTGIATAHQLGEFGLGIGLSYRLASEFEPVADTTLHYSPGNEVRLRLALDRNLGNGKLTAGFTFQNFTEDRLDGRDLFQPGRRLRGDFSYSFRTGPASAWTAYLTDIWRAHGDVVAASLHATDGSGLRVGSQNLLLAGILGTTRLFDRTVNPAFDVRLQTREDAGGQGWLAGGGLDLPLHWRGLDLTPGGRLQLGSLEDLAGKGHGYFGGELSLAVRFGGH